METKHTPGLWEIGQEVIDGKDSLQIFSRDHGGGSIIARVFNYQDNKEANARLIAAAPELLEALMVAANVIGGIKQALELGVTLTPDSIGGLKEICTAIARATGK